MTDIFGHKSKSEESVEMYSSSKSSDPHLEHRTTKKYREWHLKRVQGRNTYESAPHAPYGVGPGNRPIQGPPNWDQIWTHRTMGHDYKISHPRGKSLLKSQDKYLKEHPLNCLRISVGKPY